MQSKKVFTIIFLIFILTQTGNSQNHKLIESNSEYAKISFDFTNQYKIIDTLIDGIQFQRILGGEISFRRTGEPWLPSYSVSLGIEIGKDPSLEIVEIEKESYQNKFIVPYPNNESYYEKINLGIMDPQIYAVNKAFPEKVAEIPPAYIMRYARIQPVLINPFQFNPVTRELSRIKKITVKVYFNSKKVFSTKYQKIEDSQSKDFLKTAILNYDHAINWIGKEVIESPESPNNHWYDPTKNWFKLYLNKKGLFRISYQEFAQAGANLPSEINSNNIQIYQNGTAIPIEVVDMGDGKFGIGDYIHFIGSTPPSSPYTNQNLYNKKSVYWFTYEVDSSKAVRYRNVSGKPPVQYTYIFESNVVTDRYEVDSLYEKLGYANNEKRDYWYWGTTTAKNFAPEKRFYRNFTNFKELDAQYPVRLRVNLHGITSTYCHTPGGAYAHNVDIYINNTRVGNAKWDGQESYTFDGLFWVGPDSVAIYPDENVISIIADSVVCTLDRSDVVRINWFEFSYYSWSRAFGNYYYLTDNHTTYPVKRQWLTRWQDSTMKVFAPNSGKIIDSAFIPNDIYQSAVFVDTTSIYEEYYCVGLDTFNAVDSIKSTTPSFIRQVTNGADYIIIYHPKFKSNAERLKAIRENYFPDTSISNPRIMLVDINEIYDIFSAGYLDPNSLREFVKFSFEYYSGQAPSYIVLIGDMSYDYRKIFHTSRENFIPSPTIHSMEYGQAASDNGIAAVVGDDVVPDLMIGRISIETVEEGNIYLDKVENYPADATKRWKEKILLLSSGLDQEDENRFKFNDASYYLQEAFVTKNGLNSKMIVRFPNLPIYEKYKGTTKDIRDAINTGAAVVSYYGHGGGAQWDAAFLRDDIYLLQNAPRYPFIGSVTCYTAHFDNQDVFGEQFIKVPNKGAIGFFGSSGLTHWEVGQYINRLFFDELCNKKNYITGKAILSAKARVSFPYLYYGNMISLLTLLGEPLIKLALPEHYDFSIRNSSISMRPENPLIGDTLTITVKLENLGLVTGQDSVFVELLFTSNDTSGLASKVKIPVFANEDSVKFTFIPKYGGLYKFDAKINLTESVFEPDFSDNMGSASYAIYSIDEPSIINPINGYTSDSSFVTFQIANIGYYINKSLEYVIEIDTSFSFSNPLIHQTILSQDGLIEWKTPILPSGAYFWRSRINDGTNVGRWSQVRTFRNLVSKKKGYEISENQLKMMSVENLIFSPDSKSLFLNTELLPPYPSEGKWLEDIKLDSISSPVDYTCLTTDGKYFYIANLSYYSYFHDSTGRTRIYKFGTGNEGTVKGRFYGTIEDYYHQVTNTIFYHGDGYLYTATRDPYKILRINLELSVNHIDTITVPAGFLNGYNGTVSQGAYYLTSDSQYVYNLAFYDSLNQNRYTLRIFDPANNWALISEHYYPYSESFVGFVGFMVIKGFLYPYENYSSGYLRRINIADGSYDADWTAWDVRNYNVDIRFYAWTYDWKNNYVYATNYGRIDSLKKKLSKFVGSYVDAKGLAVTPAIGLANKWNSLSYSILDGGLGANYSVQLEGLNRDTRLWDSLQTGVPSGYSLENIDAGKYQYLRAKITVVDSSLNSVSPIKIKQIGIEFEEPAELQLLKKNLTFSPDSVQQGFPITLSLNVENIGKTKADSVIVSFLLDDSDSIYSKLVVSVNPLSLTNIAFPVPTDTLVLEHRFKALIDFNKTEYYSFNNVTENSFYISRDSLKPVFRVTFDDKEIVNGDLISRTPSIRISMQDDSPLPLDTTLFTIILDNVPLGFANNNINFAYSPYPNSEAIITFTPILKEGKHILDILAKDASGNFFDTTFNRSIFYVYEGNDIQKVYNFPNPYKDDTHFIYELRGANVPDEIKFRIYTIAGRLIKEITLTPSDYEIGFNKQYWDGKDQDGDEIANGVYLYKMIAKYSDKTRTEILKLVKMK
ncbi:MAG: C25 family cysteine peptidase [Ignavibacteriaceae bacterium]